MSSPTEPENRPLPPQPVLMPWEDRALSFFARLWGTLGNALAPVRGVPALCSGPTLPAWSFALLTSIPAMLLWGIIPFTNTLEFGPSAHVNVRATAENVPIWFDVVRAAGVGFGMSLVSVLAWGFPFVSLLKAFGDARVPPALVRTIGLRFVLYRAWLVPAASLAYGLVAWLAPAVVVEPLGIAAFIAFSFAPTILVLVGAQATAGALGAGALGAIGVAIVPAIMQQVVSLTAAHLAAQLIPTLPQP